MSRLVVGVRRETICTYAVVPLAPISFMKIRTSEAFGFPSEPVETVMSRVLRLCRAARETRSTYCEDTADAFAMTAASNAVALWSASANPAVKSSIYHRVSIIGRRSWQRV